MGRWERGTVLAVIVMGFWPCRALADPVDLTHWSHRVRATESRLAQLLAAGMRRSETLHLLVEQIDRTDGLVFVTRGRCGHGVRACLKHALTVAGPHRLLYITVDASKTDRELIGSLAHELTHALEVLDRPQIRSSEAVFYLYMSIGIRSGGRFETEVAIAAGERARRETRANQHAPAQHSPD